MTNKQQFPKLAELIQAIIIDSVTSVRKIMHNYDITWNDVEKMTNPQTKETMKSIAKDFNSIKILAHINNSQTNNNKTNDSPKL